MQLPEALREEIARLAARLAPLGIDLVQPLATRWYDEQVAAEYRLPRPAGRDDALALVVASTRAFWTPFLAELAREPARLDEPDPIDRYVRASVTAALAEMKLAHVVRFSFDPPPRRVAMQRLAHVSGLAPLTPGMLCVHPVHGPWLALRAAIVLDAPPPDGPPPVPALACDACSERCVPALARAQAASVAAPPGADPVAEQWRAWLAVRDACPVGRAQRYPEPYLEYVYTKDRGVLRRAVAALRASPNAVRSLARDDV